MRVIDAVQGERQWNSSALLPGRLEGRLRERLHAEQPDAVAFVQDFVRILSTEDGDVADGSGIAPARATTEPDDEPDDVVLLCHVAALYELFTRESGRRLRRVERPDLENALQQRLIPRTDPESGDGPLDLTTGCTQPWVFNGVQAAVIADLDGRGAKRLRIGCLLMRVVIDAFDAAADPDGNTSHPPGEIWTPDRVEEALSVSGDPTRREALAAAALLRDPLVPRLVAQLERWVADPSVIDTEDPALGIHALFLLAFWREPAAAEVFLGLLRRTETSKKPLLGEILMAMGGVLMASVIGPAPERYLEFIRDRSVDGDDRTVALDALAVLEEWGEIDRPLLVQSLRRLFEGDLEPGRHRMEWFGLVAVVMQAGLNELAPEAERAFREGYVDPTLISVREFREALRDSAERRAAGTRPGIGRLRDQDLAPITVWLDEDPLNVERRLAMERVLQTDGPPGSTLAVPYVAPVSVGRNDPCPCGSGRKHKKCCGA